MKNEKRIAELLALPAALIATDEGTHAAPTTYRIYETVTGRQHGDHIHMGSVIGTCSMGEADRDTAGRLRHLGGNAATIRAAARELLELRRR